MTETTPSGTSSQVTTAVLKSKEQIFQEQAQTASPMEQNPDIQRLKREMPEEEYTTFIKSLLDVNPLQKLDLTEFCRIFKVDLSQLGYDQVLNQLNTVKQLSKYISGRRLLISAFPKSGSSYLSNQLSVGLRLPFQHLTTSAHFPSQLGMNGREQELCDFALCRKMLKGPGFVAQHHMKGTLYLVNLLKQYGVKVILTVRNIFDALISMDDMFMKESWHLPSFQPAWKLPINYQTLNIDERMTILGDTIGIWYLDFYLSWLRLKRDGSDHLVIRYEKHLSKNSGNKQLLFDTLATYLNLNDAESNGLHNALLTEDFSRNSARFNQGITGRGKDIPTSVREHIIRHATFFQDELTATDWHTLFGTAPA